MYRRIACPMFAICLFVVAASVAAAPAPQTPPTPQQRAAMLKQWLQASQAQMRSYEWIETTVVSVDGEQKSRTQKRCYFGADGVLEKVVQNQSEPESSGPPGVMLPGRLLKHAAAHRKEEMTEYMQSAQALVHSYVPPQSTDIQAAIGAGKMSMQIIEPNRRVQLNFADFKKPGDQLGVQVEIPTNRLLGLSVNSYLDSPSDAVVLNVSMAVLPDGTIYASHTELDAVAKKVTVTVDNSGYRHLAQ